MAIATITSKGQVTIPIQIRTEFGLNPGDRIDFVKNETGKLTLIPKNRSVQRLKGKFGKFHRTVSVEEMNEAIARGAAGLPELESAVENL